MANNFANKVSIERKFLLVIMRIKESVKSSNFFLTSIVIKIIPLHVNEDPVASIEEQVIAARII